jgi:hypothetical protein
MKAGMFVVKKADSRELRLFAEEGHIELAGRRFDKHFRRRRWRPPQKPVGRCLWWLC